jgi:serine protease
MNVASRRPAGLAACASLAGAALLAATAGGQGPLLATRALVSEVSAPAIDRGLHSLDPPREPGGRVSARAAGADEPFVRGSVIVKFREGVGVSARRAMARRIDGTAGPALSYADFDLVAIDPAADPESMARVLDAQPDVEYAQARYRVHPRFVPNDPFYARQWNYPAIDMERAWDINSGASSRVTVAVLDTGVAYRGGIVRFSAQSFFPPTGGGLLPALGAVDVPFAAAPDLGAPERFVAPRDFIWNDVTPLDFDGHGTHIAGTIGQLTNNGIGTAGMAFNVRIMPVKVISSQWDLVFGSPADGTDDVVARGIRYAADNGAQVINLSIGRYGPPAPVVRAAIEYAVARGTFVVVSGGNDFEIANRPDRFAEFAPEIGGMVTVGAVGRDRQRAFYSTTGRSIELVAPGGSLRVGGLEGGILQQTFDFDFVDTYLRGPAAYRPPRFDVFAYEYLQGTSMAAPHVAGFAALLFQQGITAPAAIEAAMERFATDLGPPGRDDAYGHGLINPRASLRGLGLLR